MKKILMVLMVLLNFVAFATPNGNNYRAVDRWVIGASLDVVSGGDLDIESGAILSVSGTAITATATELNLVDTSAQTETITTGGAVSILLRVTNIDSTSGALVATLAAPSSTMIGQIKVITLTVDNGNVTMALTNVVGGSAATTATFDAAGETLVLLAGASGKWIVIKESGVTLS